MQIRSADRLQRAELAEVVNGCGVDGLCHDHDSDYKAQHSCNECGDTGASRENPVSLSHPAELSGRINIDVRHARKNVLLQLLKVCTLLSCYENVHGLLFRQPDIVLSAFEGRKNERGRGKGTDTFCESDYPRAVSVNFSDLAKVRNTEPLTV